VSDGDARVTYRDDEDEWAVDVEGAAWAGSRHDKKVRARRAGRALAKENQAELRVHGKDGELQERRSFDQDPPS
jgi:Uncharacterized protein conserved in bacteria (DUF2188)